MSRNILQIIFLLLLSLMSGGLFSSCCDDSSSVVLSKKKNQTVYFRVDLPNNMQGLSPSGRHVVQTRSLTDENTINTIDVLSFKVDPVDPTNIKKGTFFYKASGMYNSDTQSIQIELLKDASHQTLVVLVNLRQQVENLNAVLDEQKETILNRLLLPATTEGLPNLANGMPMWGELSDQEVNSHYAQSLVTAPTVNLIRSVTKFTLACSDVSSCLFFSYFDELSVYNQRTLGRGTPDNYNVVSTAVTTPTVPIGGTLAEGSFQKLSLLDNKIAHGGEESFYLFESDSRAKVSATTTLGATCLVVKCKLSESPEGLALRNQFGVDQGYYRIDFKDYKTGQYLDLLRSHHYYITVESVEGKPALTAGEAYAGTHTLKCKVISWDGVQEDIIVEGNKRLTVDRREFIFGGDIQIGVVSLPMTIKSENTNWRITGQPTWISISQTSGISGIPTTVIISVNSNNSTQNVRSSTLSLYIGDPGNELEYLLHVSQLPAGL